MSTKTPSPTPEQIAEEDPVAALKEVERLRLRALAIERAAFRVALERSEWLEKRAAKLLGLERSVLHGRIGESGSHAELGAEARRRRAAAGYRLGNPEWQGLAAEGEGAPAGGRGEGRRRHKGKRAATAKGA